MQTAPIVMHINSEPQIQNPNSQPPWQLGCKHVTQALAIIWLPTPWIPPMHGASIFAGAGGSLWAQLSRVAGVTKISSGYRSSIGAGGVAAAMKSSSFHFLFAVAPAKAATIVDRRSDTVWGICSWKLRLESLSPGLLTILGSDQCPLINQISS